MIAAALAAAAWAAAGCRTAQLALAKWQLKNSTIGADIWEQKRCSNDDAAAATALAAISGRLTNCRSWS